MIAKCSCNNCGVHIEFEADGFQPETRAECPHCHMETILFIPPASVPQKQKNITAWLVVGAVVLTTIIAGFLLKQNPPQQSNPINEKPAAISQEQTKTEITPSLPKQSNLKPVTGAFGWKLGDQLPQRFMTEVRESDYSTTLFFTPETEWPPFKIFNLEITPDRRICSIKASAFIWVGEGESFDNVKNRVISILTEKYGLRRHIPRELRAGMDDAYEFGTDDYGALLGTKYYEPSNADSRPADSLELEYYDKSLKAIADAAHDAAAKQNESKKKAGLSKGL